jgi:hypothetical protein
MALSADRNTAERTGKSYEGPMAASAECFAGALLVRDSSGNIKPATAAASLIPVGMCEEYALESTGVAAASDVKYRTGEFKWANSAINTLTKANIGDTVYIEDDQTVGSSASGTSPAGIMTGIESDGVWVRTDARMFGTAGLLAANNLSDVGTVATARTNLGLDTMAVQAASAVAITGGTVTGITDLAIADGGTGASTAAAARAALGSNQMALTMRVANLVAADAKVYRVVAPVAGDIEDIQSVLEEAALAGGDATLTFSINGTPITTGAITITQAASAAGDVDSTTPTAANTVALDDVIECTVGGANTDTDAFADVTLRIAY